jgi:Myb/SANT-like DNA-binding domain
MHPFSYSCPWASLTQVTEENNETMPDVIEEAQLHENPDITLLSSFTAPADKNVSCIAEGFSNYVATDTEDFSQPVTLGSIMAMDEPIHLTPLKKSRQVAKKKKITKNVDSDAWKWSEASVEALVEAKRLELHKLLDKKNTKFHMLRAPLKWEEIASHLKNEGFNVNWTQCRDKWQNEYTTYKRLSDFQHLSGQEDYFTMDIASRKSLGFPLDYNREKYDIIDSVCKDRANINPPGVGDSGLPRNSSTSESKESKEIGKSGDDYNTSYLRKPVSERKRKLVAGKDVNEKEENSIESILENFGEKFCNKMSGVLSEVMENASQKQEGNVATLVQAAHEDVKSMTSILEKLFQT